MLVAQSTRLSSQSLGKRMKNVGSLQNLREECGSTALEAELQQAIRNQYCP